ncbi:uncharacterized protein [Chelonus insularis]|uniref:uncharacterized protein n=1 Tax=Chelonus insularis TaxID=460826 RepID=UPI00158D716B|nr:uncharacterized protein LOC118066026 [Chelonus insularis]
MQIKSLSDDFEPTNFEILDFYGEEMCFLWQDDKIALFSYNINGSNVQVLPIVAPKLIKSIHSYLGRIFLVCKPFGIYKFTKTHEFALLSVSGFGIGTEYFEVLILKDNSLFIENKRERKIQELLVLPKLSLDEQNEYDTLNFLLLTSKTTHEKLKNILFPKQDSICLISSRKSLYTLFHETIQIMYEGLYNITDIIPIKKNNFILGLLLITGPKHVIFVSTKDDQLFFKKIYFNVEVDCLCTGFLDDSEDTIWIIYSDKQKIYFAHQNINWDGLHKVSWKRNKIIRCKNYKNKTIVLNSLFQLEEVTFNSIKSHDVSRAHEDFYEIKTEMLTGSELIVENICESAKELDKLNQKLLLEKEKLHRINIFTHKQKIPCVPKINVDRSGHFIFLKVCFENHLPPGSYITINVICNKQTTFSSKLVEDNETTLEVLLKPELLDSSIDVNFDLVTFAEEEKPWCILNDCLKDPSLKEKHKVKDFLNSKMNFLNSKLNILRNLVQQDNQIDEKKILNIKKSLRREIPDI